MAFVLVTAAGLQTFRLARQGLAAAPVASASVPGTVAWYRYQHDSRLLLLGSADQRDKLHIFQLTQSVRFWQGSGVTLTPHVRRTVRDTSNPASRPEPLPPVCRRA